MKRSTYLVLIGFMSVGVSNLQAATEIWQKDFSQVPTWQKLTTDGNLILSANSVLSVYQGVSGKELWQRDDVWASSASDVRFLGQSGLLLAEPMPADQVGKKKKRRKKRKRGEFQSFVAIDVLSGERLWNLDFLRGELIDIRVVEQANVAFVFQTVKTKDRDASGIYLTAVNLSDGSVRWESQYADRRARLTSSQTSDLKAHADITLHEGVAYVPFLGLHAIDMKTGKVLWQVSFRKKMPEYIASYAAPLVVGSSVYATDTGVVYAFDKSSGKQRWRAKVRRAGVIPELQMAGSLLLARFGGTFSNRRRIQGLSSYGVAGIDTTSGEILWNFDDAQNGITNLIVQHDLDRIMFADAVAVMGLSISEGELLFAAPLAFYRQYGIFKAKKSGFAISGGYSKTDSSGTSGRGGGLGGGGCSFDIGDVPIDIRLKGDEVVIRGQSHIMTFDPRVMLVQWSAIFSETTPSDRTMLLRGELPVFSARDLSYYLTEMSVGRGRNNRDQLMVLGIDKQDGKVKSRLDIPGRKPRLIVDHSRDRLYLMLDGKKKSMQLTAYAM